MGEARRRADQGLPPRDRKNIRKNIRKDDSPRIVPWLPVTQNQKNQFYAITTRGAWIGIGLLVVLWIVVRFVGPALGWWVPADTK